MKTAHLTTLHSLRAAQNFLREYGHTLGTVAQSGLVQRLDAIIASVYDLTSERTVADLRYGSLTLTEESLRAALLRNHLTPIVRIARADLPHTPEFKVLRMPAGRPTLDQLVDAARAMAALAERFAGTFTAVGMPADFIDALHATVQGLLRTRDARIAARAQRHGAVEGLTAAISEGRSVLRAIDLLMSTELHDDAALLTNWRTVIAVRRKPGRRPTARHKRIPASS